MSTLQVAKESGDNVLYCNSLMALGDTVNQNVAALLRKEQEDETGNHLYVTKEVVDQAIKYYDECLVVARRNNDLTRYTSTPTHAPTRSTMPPSGIAVRSSACSALPLASPCARASVRHEKEK